MAAGLDRVAALGVGEGYAEVEVGAVGQVGLPPSFFGRLEAGWHPTPWADLFGYAQGTVRPGLPAEVLAGLGARVRW